MQHTPNPSAELQSLGKPLDTVYSRTYITAKRGPVVKSPSGKTRITIRIDDDVLAWFREQVNLAGGGNYQTLVNQALREFIESKNEPLEAILRRVIREEMRTSA